MEAAAMHALPAQADSRVGVVGCGEGEGEG